MKRTMAEKPEACKRPRAEPYIPRNTSVRGQGSLEYLLIAVAAVALAGVVILAIMGALQPASHQRDIELDKIDCGNSHLWLKQYPTAYNGTLESAPGAISYYQSGEMQKSPTTATASEVTGETGCLLQGKYKLNFSRAEGMAWLETNDPANWIEYAGSAAAAGPLTATLAGDKASGSDPTCGSSSVLQDQSAWHYLKFEITGEGSATNPTLTLNKDGLPSIVGEDYIVGAITKAEYNAMSDGAGAEFPPPTPSLLKTFSFGVGYTSVAVSLPTTILNYKDGNYLYLRIAPPSLGGVQAYFCRAASSNPPSLSLT